MSIMTIFQVVVSVLLVAAVLVQKGGEGVGSAFGGGDALHHTKRGAEKWLFTATVVLAVLFLAATAASIVL